MSSTTPLLRKHHDAVRRDWPPGQSWSRVTTDACGDFPAKPRLCPLRAPLFPPLLFFFLLHEHGTLSHSCFSFTPNDRRTWKLISDASTDDVVAWANDGRSFIIKDVDAFPALLPKTHGFLKSDFLGFLRELNIHVSISPSAARRQHNNSPPHKKYRRCCRAAFFPTPRTLLLDPCFPMVSQPFFTVLILFYLAYVVPNRHFSLFGIFLIFFPYQIDLISCSQILLAPPFFFFSFFKTRFFFFIFFQEYMPRKLSRVLHPID